MNKDNPQFFTPYKINIKTGDLEKIIVKKATKNHIAEYFFDKEGVLKAYIELENGIDQILYYKTAKGFKKRITTTWKDVFYLIDFDYSTAYSHDAFVASNLQNNTLELLRYDFKENKVMERIYSDKIFDLKK